MSVLFFDSFDHYTSNTTNFLGTLRQEYVCDFPFGYPHLMPGRHTNYALYLTSLNIDCSIKTTIPSLNEMTYFIMGFQFKKIGNQTYSEFAISFQNPGIVDDYNKVRFNNNQFKLATSTQISPAVATINDEDWHHIEIKMYYPGTGTWLFYVDGVQTGSWTPTSTITWSKNIYFEVNAIDTVLITNDASKGWFIDDFYLLDSFGSAYNNIVGTNARIETLKPTQDVIAESSIKNTTYGYESQDNVPINNSQYIRADVNGDVDYDQNSTFEYENLSTIRNIGALKQNNIVAVNNANLNWPYDFVFLNNNQEVGAVISTLDAQNETLKTFKSITFNNNPQTDTNWTLSDVNSSNFGFSTKNQNIIITKVKDSLGDLYYPTMTTDDFRFESNAYILMFSNTTATTLVNPNIKLWDTITSGFTTGVDAPLYASNYMLVKKRLNGLETNSQIAALQSVTNHSFALMFVTSSKNENFYFLNSITDGAGNRAFPSLNYEHSPSRHTILPIRIAAPIRGVDVSGTNISGTTGWTSITSGLSYSKFYHLTTVLKEHYEGDTATWGDPTGPMTAQPVIAPTCLMNLLLGK